MGTCTICTKPTTFAVACTYCLDALFVDLREIAREYRRLDPNPRSGGSETGRRSPGFGSQSPANDHVIALRDRRTRARVHGDLQNAHTFMVDWLHYVQRYRGMALSSPVSIEAAYYALYSHQDFIGRQEWVTDLAMGTRSVLGQLRSANGDEPPTKIGTCTCTGSLILVGGFVCCKACAYRESAAELIDQHYAIAAA